MRPSSHSTATSVQRTGVAIHLSIAEGGKVHAIEGRHDEALRHYREAIRLAVSSKAPDLFFQHYTQCVVESLEQLGHYAEIIDYCEAADAHFSAMDTAGPMARRTHAAIMERWGAVLAKQGLYEDALEPLNRALSLSDSKGLTVAPKLRGWLRRHMRPDASRITQLQKAQGYFQVDKTKIDNDRVQFLPKDTKSDRSAPTPFQIGSAPSIVRGQPVKRDPFPSRVKQETPNG